MAFIKILVSVLLGTVAGQNSRTFPFSRFSGTFSNDISATTPTPVPILKYIDQQNNDGSYTYGYQSADGTYKIETRLVSGEVRGKYGYIDSNGELKETTYGATAEGFKPVVDGLDYSKVLADAIPRPLTAPATVPRPLTAAAPRRLAAAAPRPLAAPAVNTNLVEADAPAVSLPRARAPVPRRQQQGSGRSRFDNFKARTLEPTTVVKQDQPAQQDQVKIVNGRRAVLKRRKLRVKPAAVKTAVPTAAPAISEEDKIRARQAELAAHEAARKSVIRLQQNAARFETSRSSFFQQQQQQQQQQIQQQQQLDNPFVSGLDLSKGVYKISY